MSARAITAAEVVAAWPVELNGISLLVANRIGSTQEFARRCIDRLLGEGEEPPPFAVAALEQSAGRGRRGRSWDSAAGLGVWVTLVVRASRELVPSIPMRAGVALAEACAELGADVRLKWPNDLVAGDRKLGGLLVDVVARERGDGWALVGFGVDCFHRAEELPEPAATSLALARGGSSATAPLPGLERLLPRFVSAVFERVTASDDWLERYRELSAHSPGDSIVCALDSERVEGSFLGFDERGFLRLSTASGERVLSSGDVFAW